ncbi:MAG: TauD/TfdA family dioxygenase [Mycobacteriales bacterium]
MSEVAAGEVPMLTVAGSVAGRRAELLDLVGRAGAVLVRGLGVRSAADVAAARDALGLRPAELREHFAPRAALGDGTWAAPEWAADREMCLHHEQSYAVELPWLLLTGVLRAPDAGGEALLGDTRAALAALPAPLAARFRRDGWRLLRNFRPHFGLPWSAAYGTDDPRALAHELAGWRIGWQWRDGGVLHTEQRRPAVLRHPVTGEDCWTNQLAFFSAWSIDRAEREILLGAFGPDGVPFTTAHGDGQPLAEEDFRAVLDAYDEILVPLPVQPGDLLLLDNLLTAHGRRPYTGARELAVAPAEPLRLESCAPAQLITAG